MADGRRPTIDEFESGGDRVGSAVDGREPSPLVAERSIPGRGIRIEVGEREAERVRPATEFALASASASASFMRRSSRAKSRCRTEMARSWIEVIWCPRK
jgi:hypothetical protein